jgi:hypothetical protein
MNALDQWLVAESHLKNAASNLCKACTTLQTALSYPLPSYLDQVLLRNTLRKIQSRIVSIESTEKQIVEPRVALKGLLNLSTSHVPTNRVPPEDLSQIFSMAVSSSPCCPA